MVDLIQNDYQTQLGNQSTIMAINKGFRERQLSREQAGAIAGYLEKFNSFLITINILPAVLYIDNKMRSWVQVPPCLSSGKYVAQ